MRPQALCLLGSSGINGVARNGMIMTEAIKL